MAGQQNAGVGSGVAAAAAAAAAGMTPRQRHDMLSQAIRASAGGDLRSLNELNEFLSRSRAGRSATLPSSAAAAAAALAAGTGVAAGADEIGSGAAAAAGVLMAEDEDGEDDVEADLPRDFEYFTDGEEEEEE